MHDLTDPAGIAALAAGGVALIALLLGLVLSVRVRRLRAFNALLIVAWSALAVVALIREMVPPWWVTGALCAIALYFLAAGLLRKAEAD